MTRRIILFTLFAILIVGGILGYRYYSWIYEPNTPEEIDTPYLMIRNGTSVQALADTLESKGLIRNSRSFLWVADKMSFEDNAVKSGRYKVDGGMTNRQLIHMLRLGRQEAVDLIIRPANSVEQLCGRIATQVMVDSAELLSYLIDTFRPNSDYTAETLLSMFIPNTYEVYWNLSAESVIQRLEREHDRFWNETRLAKAEALNLTPVEVYTLASIVERETSIDAERQAIAGVYLNRLERGMLLQADPTVIFAAGEPGLRRVLYRHLEIDSPYNTYMYAGLPPGPITMPSMASLLAVLNSGDHDYLFFCAKPGGGGHAFAETLRQHSRNAREYQEWLNEAGIR